MSHEQWQQRHRLVRNAAFLSVPALLLVGLAGPTSWIEALFLPMLPLGLVLAGTQTPGTRAKSQLTSLSLISSSFILINATGGSLHAHLYILTAVAFVALYQRWSPLVVTILAVVVHHLLFGLFAPARVMSMPGMTGMAPAPTAVWLMVATHAIAVVLEVLAILMWWHFAEAAETEMETHRAALDAERQATAEAQARQVQAEAETQRQAAELLSARSDRLAQDAEVIRGLAGRAAEAVNGLQMQSDMLQGAVNDIAQRCQATANTAREGQLAAEHAANDATHLEAAVAEIAGVNALIESLAEQTNLLSLNATIEAARAGEAGKGFGVVATEVKSLAAATAESTQKVRTVVDVISQEAHKVSDSFRSSNAIVTEIGDSQTAIAAAVDEQAAVLAEVARQTSDAAEAARAITDAIETMLHNAKR